jgi:hypothetical protein
MKMIRNIGAAVVLAVSFGSAANAATVVFSGNTTTAPTYNRAFTTTTLSAAGTNVAYQSFSFTVDAAGAYTFDAVSAFDNFLSLYTGAFNPSSALTDITAVDDDSGIGANAQLTANLLAGAAYNIVFTSYSNSDRGAFTLTAAGPGTVRLAAPGAVPEPATWAMMILGMGAVGFAMRRRMKVSEVNFTNKVRAIAAA